MDMFNFQYFPKEISSLVTTVSTYLPAAVSLFPEAIVIKNVVTY